MTRLNKKSGQALIETLLILPLICACFSVCLLSFHVHAQYLWMDHHLYQALICLAKGKKDCKDNMTKKIKSFLWAGSLNNIQFKTTENKWSGTFTWQTFLWKIPFKKHLKLGELRLL